MLYCSFRLQTCCRLIDSSGNRHYKQFALLQVFGERPPVQTLVMLESELYEHMTIAEEERPESAKEPALMLLWEFFSVSANANAAGGFHRLGGFTDIFLFL